MGALHRAQSGGGPGTSPGSSGHESGGGLAYLSPLLKGFHQEKGKDDDRGRKQRAESLKTLISGPTPLTSTSLSPRIMSMSALTASGPIPITSGTRTGLGVVDEYPRGLGLGVSPEAAGGVTMKERLRERRSVAVFGRSSRKSSGMSGGLKIGKGGRSGALTDYEVSESEAEGPSGSWGRALSVRSGVMEGSARRYGLEPVGIGAEFGAGVGGHVGEGLRGGMDGEGRGMRKTVSARRFFTKFA